MNHEHPGSPVIIREMRIRMSDITAEVDMLLDLAADDSVRIGDTGDELDRLAESFQRVSRGFPMLLFFFFSRETDLWLSIIGTTPVPL